MRLIEGEVSFEGAHGIVFSTVPQRIIGEVAYRSLGIGTLMVELASKPGGFDPAIAERCGMSVMALPSLPARYAPLSAATYIYGYIKRVSASHGI